MEFTNKINGAAVRDSLDTRGYARIESLLSRGECASIIKMYDDERLFRSTINMQRYRFGQGEYKYFAYPLPSIVQSLRENMYAHLVSIANDWMAKLDTGMHYPPVLEEFLTRCHSLEQRRPTPLVLRYETGGFNTLHQDIYGEIFFPFQVVFMLTQSGKDHEGGELVFVEQVPRAQSRAEVVHLNVGDAVVFTTNFRPIKGSKGYYRAVLKHGVSQVRSGIRYTMGVIFHDAN